MAVWWMTEGATLLPIILIPALTQCSVGETTASYANPMVFLCCGGFLIAITMEKWGLREWIGLWTLRKVGISPRRIVLGMMLASGYLAMCVSNTATPLMILPIGFSVIALVLGKVMSDGGSDRVASLTGEEVDPQVERFGICLVLASAWSRWCLAVRHFCGLCQAC